jgi:4-diphosphocytidyl-2-C-methyl-D-erythritol kinase
MRWCRAPAKVNLTLRVIRRRPDGFHDIESLVAFADPSDWLGFRPGRRFGLTVDGLDSREIGPPEQNLVARAAQALCAQIPGLLAGEFHLIKRLPAAAGIGGGSSDAAACIRALAEANGLSLLDKRVQAAALDTGSDVAVCLSARARMMAGVGDRLGAAVRLPLLFAVLVNPRQHLSTKDVFEALGMEGRVSQTREDVLPACSSSEWTLDAISSAVNDLEHAATKILPLIGELLVKLRRLPGARMARMSGSGATCFALFDDPRAAGNARRCVASQHPNWWVTTTTFR